jgi:Peptidase family M28
MRPAETIATLASYERRGAGTNAERRAAAGLAQELERDAAGRAREIRAEPFWCRPNWALAHAWHALLGLAGSLVAESQPRIGAALLAIALLSVVADAFTGRSIGRRLTPERASQNIISEPEARDDRVRLIITANYDAGRTGLVYRDRFRRPAAALARVTGRLAPGWLGWITIALVWLLVIAILRFDGHRSTSIGIAQLVPTVGLVVALALLLEAASAGFGPAANDNATGVAAAIALVGALGAAPSPRMAVELVLQGAGDGGAIGLRQYLRRRRKTRRAPNTVVVGIAACGAGTPHWWYSDGPLVPVGYFGPLRRLCQQIAKDEPDLKARTHRGRGTTPALPARLRRLPAITIGSLEQPGIAPRSHQADDTPAHVDGAAVDQIVEFGLTLTDAIDAFIASRQRGSGQEPRRPAAAG